MTEASPKTLWELISDQPWFKGLLLWSLFDHRRLKLFPHSYRPESRWAERNGMTAERLQQLQEEEAFLREPGQSASATAPARAGVPRPSELSALSWQPGSPGHLQGAKDGHPGGQGRALPVRRRPDVLQRLV